MAIVRYQPVANTLNPAAAMTINNTSPVVSGEDYGLKIIRRTLSAGDIGAGAGQTGDNADTTVSATAGCLIAQFSGSIIKDVIAFGVYRPGTGNTGVAPNPGRGWNRFISFLPVSGQAAQFSSTSWRISADGSSLYLKDSATNAAAALIAGDIVIVGIVLGNV